ncbi:MAG: MMPL family transporter, partial [Deltaproteobacteria bacterium]|nr:MMPL family transporter [Deltaproteobacteria bacterium]
MKFFVKFIDRYAPYILLAVLAVTVCMVPGIKRITIARGFDNDSLPAFNELVKSVKEVRKTFAANMRQVIIAVEAQPGYKVTDGHSLELIQKLTNTLKGIKVVKRDSLMSLSTVKSVQSSPDGISSEKLLAKLPSGSIEEAEFENRLAHDPFYYGRLISKDFRSSLILATAYDSADLAEIHNAIASAIEPLRASVPGVTITLVGDPEINYQLNASIEKDIIVFVLLAVGLILLSFLGIFRSWNGVILPLAGILVGIIWTMGLMGYYGEPILIISATLPVVLVVIGSEYGIHVYHVLSEETAHHQTFRQALTRAVSTVFSPLAMATMATFTGGMSLITFKIRPIQHFGIFMGIGTLILMFIAIVVIPALFKVLHKPAEKLQKSVVGGIMHATHLAENVLNHVP